ncbi:endonuclease/exonuclease/phosphatase family protein [Bosea sp. 117]|uniref:endonuclease/exonuclease/phosphatase family protein n=1 Tax=Bosea sp. 117 TaxID=1125973 RepID=UPI0004949F14|nr:endonuclease/exonuclease/phosphatase family protein [Bosea sp. 117]
MRIASFNVENMFERARALNQESWSEGRPILELFSKLNALLSEPVYTDAIKQKIAALLIDAGLEKKDDGEFVMLRQNHGKLLKRPQTGGIQIVADGRESWIGWIELKKEAVNERATRNTARVIADVAADILGVIEAENRVALRHFNTAVLEAHWHFAYRHVMLIDGNDDRGIDVGVMTRPGFPIEMMRSHVDATDEAGERIFRRDCPEFAIRLPGGQRLWLLVNHFKSKGYGSQSSSNETRRKEAAEVAAIYGRLRDAGEDLVAVVGDLNDTPPDEERDPLTPLLSATDLRDVSAHSNYVNDGHPGTYGGATASGKIDYILLSPALFARVTGAGVWRKGAWPGVRPRKWEVYEDIEKPIHAASDHAAIWADIDI